jgi:hypothetical protein
VSVSTKSHISATYGDALAILFPLAAGAVILWLMGAFTYAMLALLGSCLLFLAVIQVQRWEKRVNTAVERYIKVFNESPSQNRSFRSLQMLCDAVGLTLRNNFELRAVRRQIRKRGLPDPADSYEILKRGNLYRFFAFVRKNNLRLDKPGSLAAATMHYKGLF